MASITIAFDAGTSGSKVIASYPSGECVFNDEDYFLVKPAVRSLTPETSPVKVKLINAESHRR